MIYLNLALIFIFLIEAHYQKYNLKRLQIVLLDYVVIPAAILRLDKFSLLRFEWTLSPFRKKSLFFRHVGKPLILYKLSL